MRRSQIVLVAALNEKTRCIGNGGKLPWTIPDERARFHRITTGRPVIMGRKTWLSLPPAFRPLPDRINVVISRDPKFKVPAEVIRVRSPEEALERARSISSRNTNDPDAEGFDPVYVMGGGEVFSYYLPIADRLSLTLIQSDTDEGGDTFFPDYRNSDWRQKSRDGYRRYNGLSYCTTTYVREKAA